MSFKLLVSWTADYVAYPVVADTVAVESVSSSASESVSINASVIRLFCFEFVKGGSKSNITISRFTVSGRCFGFCFTCVIEFVGLEDPLVFFT